MTRDTNTQDRIWREKRAWHARQRALSIPEKFAIVVQLQRRQVALNAIKASLGLPQVPMRIWGEPRER